MPYTTLTDLVQRFGAAELIQQTDLTGSGELDPVAVSNAITDAAALIDGYLSGRYSLPLSVTPPLLVMLCCDLARYALYVDAAPEIIEKRRDQAVATLRDIAAGRVQLDVGQADASPPAPSGLAEVVQGHKVFGGGRR